MIQEVNLKIVQLRSDMPPKDPAELANREHEFKRLADRLQGLSIALQLQRMLGSEEQRTREKRCADGAEKKMKNFGFARCESVFSAALKSGCWLVITLAASRVWRKVGVFTSG